MFLPDEIINIILSYREINPTAKLIRKSIDEYNKTARYNKLHCYYFHMLMNKQISNKKKQSFVFENKIKKINTKWNTEIDLIDSNQRLFKNEVNKIDISMFNPQQRFEFSNEVIKAMNIFNSQENIIRKNMREETEPIRQKVFQLTDSFSNFVYDLNHSIICSGVINNSYFKCQGYNNRYELYYNEYRSEIYDKKNRKNRVNYNKSKNIKLYYPHLLDLVTTDLGFLSNLD